MFVGGSSLRAGESGALDSPVTYRVGKQRIEMLSIEEGSVVLSRNCISAKEGTPQCAAYGALDRASFTEAKKKILFYGGKNPGSLVCRFVGGEVYIAFDARGNENALCRFSDESWISCGSLAFQASLNDGVGGARE